VAVWSGQVTLTDLKLRREACYALGLPFSIKAGYIEHVELSIPWNKLGSEPVVLTMDGVYLVAGPLDEGAAQEDEAAAGEWAWSRKRGRLQRLWQAAQLKSAGLQAEGSEAAGEGGGDGKPQRDTLNLLTKIIYNLQLSFKHIHVRYEDRTHSSAPFAVGVTLAELSAHTTNADGRKAFTIMKDVHYKRAELQQLAVYAALRPRAHRRLHRRLHHLHLRHHRLRRLHRLHRLHLVVLRGL
jgi:vacuolar protein sorting-associated protein 13A/C